jgi:hypothetical protein
MPEIHGCGDAAKSAARADWINRQGQPKQGVKASDETKRKLLENKLKKKVK